MLVLQYVCIRLVVAPNYTSNCCVLYHYILEAEKKMPVSLKNVHDEAGKKKVFKTLNLFVHVLKIYYVMK